MEEKDNPKEYTKNKIVLLYIIGLVILLGGMRKLFNGEIFLGVIYILNGIIVIPVTADAIVKILMGIIETPVIADSIGKNSSVLAKIALLITNSLRYFLILVFLLGGVGYLSMGEIIPGVIYILIGIMFIPVIGDLIEKKMNL
ncbi:MAG: hypothetical protein AB9861_02495 [Methanosarcina sp.]|jgi:hypothetical protein